MAAALGGLDALVFTGGVGEGSAPVRERRLRAARLPRRRARRRALNAPRVPTPRSPPHGSARARRRRGRARGRRRCACGAATAGRAVTNGSRTRSMRSPARDGFSGVVRVDRGGEVELAKAYGLAHRGYGIPNTVDTQFAIASGTKGLTALAVVSLIEDGALELATTARSVLGTDLPLIGDDVTIEHLLSHRSGIGDYLDEDADHEIDRLRDARAGARARDDRAVPRRARRAPDASSPPGERFAYCNSGYVVLALIAERASGVPFHELVRAARLRARGDGRHRVPALRRAPGARRARLPRRSTAREDERVPPPGARQRRRRRSTPRPRTSARFWSAFFAGRIVSTDWVAEMVRPRSDVPRGVAALRPRLLAPRVERRRHAGGLRRRRLVPQRARPRARAARTRSSRTRPTGVADRAAARRTVEPRKRRSVLLPMAAALAVARTLGQTPKRSDPWHASSSESTDRNMRSRRFTGL